MKKFLVFTVFLLSAVLVAESIAFYKISKPHTDLPEEAPRSHLIEITPLSQYPDLPTGCEVTAAATVLQFYGEAVTPKIIAEDWLLCDNGFYYENGRLYGPDPRLVFVGSPFEANSYGCFARVIADAINRGSSKRTAEVITDKTLPELCDIYTDSSVPLMIWVTMSMRESADGSRWLLEDGEEFVWPAGEHCMVLCGYDEKYYHLCDPQAGSVVLYEKGLVQKRFFELGSQAVCVK